MYDSHIMVILHFGYLLYSSYDLCTFWMLRATSTIYRNLLSRCESATRLIIQRRFSLLSRSRGFYTYFPSLASRTFLRYNEHDTTQSISMTDKNNKYQIEFKSTKYHRRLSARTPFNSVALY